MRKIIILLICSFFSINIHVTQDSDIEALIQYIYELATEDVKTFTNIPTLGSPWGADIDSSGRSQIQPCPHALSVPRTEISLGDMFKIICALSTVKVLHLLI